MAKKNRLLLVEDEASLRLVASEYLRMSNFEVVEAEDGQQALGIVEKDQNFDIILLDLRLPKVDGMKVLETIKQNSKTKHLLVYMMTMMNTEKIIEEAFQKGADGYFIKDTLQPDQLRQEILDALAKSKGKTV